MKNIVTLFLGASLGGAPIFLTWNVNIHRAAPYNG
jgi:hypothetical protein